MLDEKISKTIFYKFIFLSYCPLFFLSVSNRVTLSTAHELNIFIFIPCLSKNFIENLFPATRNF